MSRAFVFQLLLIGLGVAALPVAIRVLQPAEPAVSLIASPLASVRSGHGPVSNQRSLDSLVRAAAAQAPFRLNRKPSAAPFDPDRPAGTSVVVQPAPRPVLIVSGIVWGGGLQPTAVLEGLPGVEGPRAVHIGESIGGLTVRRIREGTVVVTGLDTAWTLGVRAPWR